MNKPYCEDCKYWNGTIEDDYGACLKWICLETGRLMTREYNRGKTIFTARAFGCNFFEEEPRGPFSVDECNGIDDPCKRWFVMAGFGEIFFVKTTGLYSTAMRREPKRAIGGGLRKEDAEEIVEWLNEYWRRRENPESS